MLSDSNRLKKKKDIEKVYKKGKGYKEDFLFLKIIKNEKSLSRFGFVVGKNVSKKAFSRNKIKRRLREIVRRKLENIKKGYDCVLVVKPGFNKENFWETEETITKLFREAKILNLLNHK